MAMAHKVRGPVRVVSQDDDALVDGFDFQAYVDSDFDWSLLKFKSGAEPTVFTLKQLTTDQWEARDRYDGLSQAALTVRCGLTGLRNYSIIHADGSEHPYPDCEFEKVEPLGALLKAEWFSKARFGPRLTHELASCIVMISRATGPLSKLSPQASGGDGSA